MTKYRNSDKLQLNYDTSTIIGQIVEFSDSDDFLIPQENYYTSEENYLNEIRQKQQKNEFERKLISCIIDQHFEYGITSKSDIFIMNQMNINKLVTKSLLNELFVKNFENPSILIGILQVVSRIAHDKINPEGQVMALAALTHKNFEVRECGIRCFENWVSQTSLTILKNISTEPKWLQDYLETVITNIEEELCHT
jgi:hypothetical protein